MHETTQALLDTLNTQVAHYQEGYENIHPYDIAQTLLEVRDEINQEYIDYLSALPQELQALVLIELPIHCHEEVVNYYQSHQIAKLLDEIDTDDAAKLIRSFEAVDEEFTRQIIDELPHEDKKTLQELINYDTNQAGAHMQTELFIAYVDEKIGDSIRRLKKLKAAKEIDNVFQVYIVSKRHTFIGSIALEDLILLGSETYYNTLLSDGINSVCVQAVEDIHSVVETAARYDMHVVPVVDAKNKLLGRITSDDIYDIIEERATGQLYHLAGVNEHAEQKESLFAIGRNRALWLGINLLTAITASIVIGLFDATLQAIVALAVLMPIVASMGGNAGTQTLTVTVRQMALGDISTTDAKETILKEVLLALMNGLIFAVVMGIVAWVWFNIPLLGVVIGISMVVNLASAGFFGALIPLVLKKFNIDPAVGSSVVLTTITDIVGFFSFLGLASVILL